jgi:hypothetical protein
MNGMIMNAKVLLDSNTHPTDQDIQECIGSDFLPLWHPPASDSRDQACSFISEGLRRSKMNAKSLSVADSLPFF